MRIIALISFVFISSYCLSQNNNMLCIGAYWTEAEGNLKLKEFSEQWHDVNSWEKRVKIIKEGIIQGLELNNMPDIDGDLIL